MDVRSKARVSTPFPSSMITMNPYLDQFSLDDKCRASVPFELWQVLKWFLHTQNTQLSCLFSKPKKFSFQVHDSSSDCLLLIRRCPDLWMILASFRNGTSTAPAQARLRVTTVKSSFGTMLLTPFFISTLTCVPCRWSLELIRFCIYVFGTKSPSHLQGPVQEGEEHTGNNRPSFDSYLQIFCMNVGHGYGDLLSKILSCV